MPYVLKESIEREIERTFAPAHVEYVKRRLRAAHLTWEDNAPPPRVHAAVLWLARGDIKRFDAELEGAVCDWRDTLLAAHLAQADWKTVLEQRGIDCQDW